MKYSNFLSYNVPAAIEAIIYSFKLLYNYKFIRKCIGYTRNIHLLW